MFTDVFLVPLARSFEILCVHKWDERMECNAVEYHALMKSYRLNTNLIGHQIGMNSN